jgi:hypothetical protein
MSSDQIDQSMHHGSEIMTSMNISEAAIARARGLIGKTSSIPLKDTKSNAQEHELLAAGCQ